MRFEFLVCAYINCKTSDLIWRLQKLVSTLSVIGCLFSTHCGHSDMNLGFSEPDSHEELQFGNNTPY